MILVMCAQRLQVSATFQRRVSKNWICLQSSTADAQPMRFVTALPFVLP